MIIQVLPGVWLEILDIIRQLPREILYVLYFNVYAIFPPFYLVNSAVSNACSNLSQRGVNVCFLWCWQGAIIPRLWEQSLQQNLFELVVVGGKSMRNLMGFGSGCAVQSTGLWGSAQPNK